jgi:hypothetical protein
MHYVGVVMCRAPRLSVSAIARGGKVTPIAAFHRLGVHAFELIKQSV